MAFKWSLAAVNQRVPLDIRGTWADVRTIGAAVAGLGKSGPTKGGGGIEYGRTI